ncbi:hypothetical protein DL764_001086 [Monosporascus ibericus]|uniref:Zn(2)-C6 fungal-type domain-containing protein n=1 Tax=Monosporascus ibericus TaxID=155417 RepID=A0A4Q4TR03_9PEZI|nr:hypothetical protein DL764_001086 [Monosporascus ibericus]
MERRGPSHSGPYGLACKSCFKSKCKCVARPDGDGCQRCHRLNKQCRSSDSLRGRTREKKPNPTARIAELESKLDGLISQLQSRNVIDSDATQRQSPVLLEPPSQPAETTSVQLLGTAENEAQDSDHTEDDDDVILGSVRWSDSPKAVTASEPSESQVSEAEAEILLGTFRAYMLNHFAFVHLPAHLTAHNLRQDRPLLFRAIVCAVSPSAREKVARGRELKKAICEAMLGHESQSNMVRMDLLLALLTYISWGWDHMLNHCSPSWLMLQAKSLACEMRPDGLAPLDARVMALFTPGFESWSENTGAVTEQDFLEQHRAVLGCFVLSSVVSAYYGQVDALRWTPQMEVGLAAISTNKNCPTDATLAIQVRLQLLAQKSDEVQQQQLERGQGASTEMTPFPALMALTTLQGQLQELQMSLSPALPQRELIMAHIHSTELSISETMHAVNSMVPIMVGQFARMTGTGSMSAAGGTASSASCRHERLRCLWQCVRAVQACTSALLASPPSDFRGVSFLQWAQLARCLVVLNRLTTTIEEPAWDRTAVRAVMDVPVLLGRVAEKLELAAQAAGEQGCDDIFTRLARTMREFCPDATGSAAHEHGTARQKVGDAWPRPRAHGGAGAGDPAGMIGLIGIADDTSWLRIGRGLGTLVPMLYIQNCVPKDGNPAAVSCFVFCPNFGVAVTIVCAQTILTNGLLETIPKFEYTVSPELVIMAGSTAIRHLVPRDALGSVILAYSPSMDHLFYLCADIPVVTALESSG